jgi:hypothetical protein
MNEINKALQDQIEALAKLCNRRFESAEFDVDEAAQPIIEALVRNGYGRLSNVNLQYRLEKEMSRLYPEKTIHHPELVTSLAGDFQSAFEHMLKWETNTPRDRSDTKAANISSATKS